MMGWATALELLGGALAVLLVLHLIAGLVNRGRAKTAAKTAAKTEYSKTIAPRVEPEPAPAARSGPDTAPTAAAPIAAPAVSAPVAVAPTTVEPPPNEFSFASAEPVEPAAVAPVAASAPPVAPVEPKPIEREIVAPTVATPSGANRARAQSRRKRVITAVPPKRKSRSKRLPQDDSRRSGILMGAKGKAPTRRPKRVETPRRKRKPAVPKIHAGKLGLPRDGVGRQLELT